MTGNTSVEWVCLSTVLIDMASNIFFSEVLIHDFGQIDLDLESGEIDVDTLPYWYDIVYGNTADRIFGLSHIVLKQGVVSQKLIFDSDAVLCLNCTYSSIHAGGAMSYFLITYRECQNNLYPLYSI